MKTETWNQNKDYEKFMEAWSIAKYIWDKRTIIELGLWLEESSITITTITNPVTISEITNGGNYILKWNRI